MDAQQIDQTLSAAERELEARGKPDLKRVGFWRAVAAVKRDDALVARHADRIARIDREAFKRSVPIRLPAAVGVVADVVGLGLGVALIALTLPPAATGPTAELQLVPTWLPPLRELIFLAGMGAILGTSHTLAHWIVGMPFGIRFTHWFVVPPKRPQPGFKIDYASYLKTPAYQRAWMHASGAIVTKLVPFLALPLAMQARLQEWAIWLIVIIGLLQIATDALFSVRASDWKKFRREMRAARA